MRDTKDEIFRREHSTYGFEVLRFSDDPVERFWTQLFATPNFFAVDAQTYENPRPPPVANWD